MQKKVAIRAGVMLAAALVGIFLIGQLHKCATKDEPTWATGKAAVVWDKKDLPLAVCPLDPFDPIYIKSLKDAVSMFNGQAGVDVFKFVNGNEVDCDVVVSQGEINVGDKLTEDDIADAWLKPSPQVVFIVLRKPEDVAKVGYVFEHELGHAAGLAHDPAGRSIMYVKSPEGMGLMDDPSTPRPMVSDRDRDALKARYK